MTQIQPAIERLTHTAHFSRKVSDGNYGGSEAGIFVQFDVPLDAGPGILIGAAEDALQQAEDLVQAQLGLADPAKQLQAAFGGATEADALRTAPTVPDVAGQDVPAHRGVPADSPQRDRPPFNPENAQGEQKKANAQWAKARRQTHPGEFWDNREANAKSGADQKDRRPPDYRHKDTGLGVWDN